MVLEESVSIVEYAKAQEDSAKCQLSARYSAATIDDDSDTATCSDGENQNEGKDNSTSKQLHCIRKDTVGKNLDRSKRLNVGQGKSNETSNSVENKAGKGFVEGATKKKVKGITFKDTITLFDKAEKSDEAVTASNSKEGSCFVGNIGEKDKEETVKNTPGKSRRKSMKVQDTIHLSGKSQRQEESSLHLRPVHTIRFQRAGFHWFRKSDRVNTVEMTFRHMDP